METDSYEYQDPNLSERNEIDELRTQLVEYKVLAQSLERRIADLHKDCEQKDKEIASLKLQCLQSNSSHKVGVAHTEHDTEDNSVLCKMFVGGLNAATTIESMKEYFEKFGEVSHCTVMKDTETQRSRGFGFVIFANSSSVDAAQAARPHMLDGKVVDTKRAVPKGERVINAPGAESKRVFIGGMKTTTDDDTIRSYFSQFGEVELVEIPEDKVSKRKRGFGYVTFSDYDPVDKVTIIKFHEIDGRRCEVKKAFTREEMESMKQFAGAPDSHSPASNYSKAPPGFMPGMHGVGGPSIPGGGNTGGFWNPGGNINHAPGGFVPPAHPPACAAGHPPYGFMGNPCGSCGHPPAGMPPFPNRPPMVPSHPNMSLPSRPAGQQGHNVGKWTSDNSNSKSNRVAPYHGKNNYSQRSAAP